MVDDAKRQTMTVVAMFATEDLTSNNNRIIYSSDAGVIAHC